MTKEILSAFTLIILGSIGSSYAQTPEDAIAKFRSDAPQGIKIMRSVIAKNSTSDNWDILVTMYREKFKADEERFMLTATLLGGTLTAKPFLDACKESTLKSRGEWGSIYLRMYLIDPPEQTNVDSNAQNEFTIAEDFFGKKDYDAAAQHYRKSLTYQPDFYKGALYLGDSYWAMKNIDSALAYYRMGSAMRPELFEPYKYLCDAYRDAGQAQRAITACINGILIYPDVGMMGKLRELYTSAQMKFDWHWFPRDFNLNIADNNQAAIRVQPWDTYRNAKADVRSYCDSVGILSNNAITSAKYLEVYSWEKMLRTMTTVPKEFAFAKRMMDEGYLDCYVLVSMYHIDVHDQFRHLAATNKEKIKTYITKYLVE